MRKMCPPLTQRRTSHIRRRAIWYHPAGIDGGHRVLAKFVSEHLNLSLSVSFHQNVSYFFIQLQWLCNLVD